MSRTANRFTDEQVEALRQNQYVLTATATRISLTKEFKEIFHEEYLKGATPKQILNRYGFDTEMLGKDRIHCMAVNIRREYDKYGGFHEGYARGLPRVDNGTGGDQPETEAQKLKKLQHEVEYLKQEIEFLKKISSIRNTRK